MDFSMLYTYCLYLLGKDTSVEKNGKFSRVQKIILINRQAIIVLSWYLYSKMFDAFNLANI